jgi:hypothetical protein
MTSLSETDAEALRAAVASIAQSGLLGRSRTYLRFLEFLLEQTIAGRVPKELEIATAVFGKGPDFDPSQDSLVRVYAHNLRQKLEHYYSTAGAGAARRIEIPRGEYRLVLVTPGIEPPAARPRPRRGFAVAVVLGACLIAVVAFALGSSRSGPLSLPERVAARPLWSPLFDDELPILIVLGDYFIFGELNARGEVARLVRDFGVNSAADLNELYLREPELADRYLNLDLTYLPRGSAVALRDLLRVLYTSAKPVRVLSMSELNVADLRTNHVVYVGFISAMDKLTELVFASSGLSLGPTYDELVRRRDGRAFTSGAGLPRSDRRHYRDYGLLSSFPGPAGNQFVIIAGTRDTGLMQTSFAATDLAQVELLEQVLPAATESAPAFEVLYEVTGIDRTNLDAMPVHTGPLDYRMIWGGQLTRLGDSG